MDDSKEVDDLKTFGKKIATRFRERRAELGITQAEVADRMGIHRPIVSRHERGTYCPNLETLATMAIALDMDPGVLAFGGDRKQLTLMQRWEEEVSPRIVELEKSSVIDWESFAIGFALGNGANEQRALDFVRELFEVGFLYDDESDGDS